MDWAMARPPGLERFARQGHGAGALRQSQAHIRGPACGRRRLVQSRERVHHGQLRFSRNGCHDFALDRIASAKSWREFWENPCWSPHEPSRLCTNHWGWPGMRLVKRQLGHVLPDLAGGLRVRRDGTVRKTPVEAGSRGHVHRQAREGRRALRRRAPWCDEGRPSDRLHALPSP